jgi:peptidoglycan/LPS O-acetylase OafA/YrhL
MTESQRVEAPTFFAPLESLRGVAALIVVLYHAVWINSITSLHLVQNGALMVDFFFVLSGFVIFHSYGKKLGSGTDICRFLWLRLGRLYPLHFTFLMVFLVIEIAKLVAERKFGIVADKPAFTTNNGNALLTNLLLIHSLGVHDHRHLNFNHPSWSISTEFYAYVLFAGVRLLVADNRRFTVAATAFVAAAFGLLWWLKVVPLTTAGYDYGFIRCAGGFFLGTLTYLAYDALRGRLKDPHHRGGSLGWLSALALLATIAYLCLIDPEGWLTYLLPFFSASVILTLVLCPQRTVQNVLSSRPLRWLGKVSYSVYMVHAAIAWIITQVLTVVFKFPKIEVPDGHITATSPSAGLIALAIYVAIVLVLSGFTYRWIEEPFRRMSRRASLRWFQQPAAPLLAEPAAHDAQS